MEKKVDKEKDALLIEDIKRRRKQKIRKYTITTLLMTLMTLIIFGLTLLWQWDLSLMSIGDSLWFTFAIIFTIGWLLFVYNHNVLSPIIHGFKVFGLMFVGKRPKHDYYNYMKNIQENPLPKFYYIIFFINAFIVLIPTLIVFFILMNS